MAEPHVIYDDGHTRATLGLEPETVTIYTDGDFEPCAIAELTFQAIARAYSEYLGIPFEAFARV